MKPLLTIEQLNIAFKQQNQLTPTVFDLSLQLEQGETLALVGESGSGKTITALSILKLLPTPPAIYTGGDIYFYEQSLLHTTEKQLQTIRGNQISMIFQDPMVSLNPLHTIEKQLIEVLMLHRKMSRLSARNEALAVLEHVGLKQAKKRLNAYPHQLSGGERQRVMIAMAILTKPKLLIADEPTTALDVSIQAQILALLKHLQQEMNMGLLFITHNLNIVKQLAENVAVMQQGRIVEQNSTNTLFAAPQHVYTQQLLSAKVFTPPSIPQKTAPLQLQIKQLTVNYQHKQGLFRSQSVNIVDNVSFNVAKGETVGLVGESGSGKSTIALAILKLIAAQGEIWFDAQPLHTFTHQQLLRYRSKLQIVFQDPFSALNPRMTIGEIIAEGLHRHTQLSNTQKQQYVNTIMQEVGLDPTWQYRYPAEFSGGQRQRIAIARVLILKPTLIILDEPTSSLDKTIQQQIIQLLLELQQKYSLSYLFISHDLQLVEAICHHVIVLKQGKIVEQGETNKLFTHPKHTYTKQLIRLSQ